MQRAKKRLRRAPSEPDETSLALAKSLVPKLHAILPGRYDAFPEDSGGITLTAPSSRRRVRGHRRVRPQRQRRLLVRFTRTNAQGCVFGCR